MPATIDGYPVGLRDGDTALMPPRPVTIMVGPVDWFAGGGLLSGIKGATGLPPRNSKARDIVLRESVHVDGMWASAVNMAITKQVALGYQIWDSERSTIRISRAQQLIQSYWPHAIQRGLRDFLTTNGGQVVGIQRVARAPGAKIARLVHLDSLRCYPTYHAQYPILYNTPRGEWRLLADYDVIHLMDMPDSREEIVSGLCAADRAWDTVLKLCAMETYYREKVSGSRNLAIHFVSGISDAQLKDALQAADETKRQQGFVLYRGSTIIPTLALETPPTVVTIPLAEIPDGFVVADERRDAYLRLANAIGIFVGEVQPLSGQGLGTGTQTVVLDEAAEGRGIAAWRAELTQQINERVLPGAVTFAFTNGNDVRDRKARAEADKARIDALKAAVEAGAITPAQMANVLADEEIIPREFVVQDATAGATLDEGDKPETLDAPADLPVVETEPAASLMTTDKADVPDTGVLIDEVLATAREWAQNVLQ